MHLEHDERPVLETVAANGGRHAYRGLPLREMVGTADIAFALQRRRLVSVDVIYCNGFPEVVAVSLTGDGVELLEQISPEAVRWMRAFARKDTGNDDASVEQQLRRDHERLLELQRQLALEVEHRQLVVVERAAVERQLGELRGPAQRQDGFLPASGVLWRVACSNGNGAEAYCPTCCVALVAMASDNRLGCPECGFTAPFRPLQLSAFRPRSA